MAVGVSKAGTVLDYAPELAEQVAAGELALDAAYQEARERRRAELERKEEAERAEREEVEARAFVEERAPDLAARIAAPDSELRTAVEARAVWEQRNREEAARRRAEREGG